MAPVVSVVVSAHQAEAHLRSSLRSVLAQEVRELELIVVDDGSRDATPERLSDLASEDRRVRVLTREHRGLTAALIAGCAEARGEFIARHDADDLSLPTRLAKQIELLRGDPTVELASCWSHAIGPRGEPLYQVRRPTDAAAASSALRRGAAGPSGHGSVMFRRRTYERVGGYRAAFRYAQDWDLWLRLAELGQVAFVPELLYAFRISEASTSSSRRRQQVRIFELAQACARARLERQPEEYLLAEVERVSAEGPDRRGWCHTAGAYFIGRCLAVRRDRRCLQYLRRAVLDRPLCPRTWLAWLGAWALCGRAGTEVIT